MTFPAEPTRRRPGDTCPQALFAVLQYHHDRSRQEGVNVGVLFLEEATETVRVLTLPEFTLQEVVERMRPRESVEHLGADIRGAVARILREMPRNAGRRGILAMAGILENVRSINGIHIGHDIGTTVWDDPDLNARHVFDHVVRPLETDFPEEAPVVS